MRNPRISVSRRLGLFLSLGAVVALAITSATAARVDADSPGSSSTVSVLHNDKITICHAAGQADTTKFVTLTLSENAVFGNGGHFYNDGTPRAGHELDYFGPCVTPPGDDVCPNIDGVQHSVPDGMVKDEHGNCVTPPPPPPPPPPPTDEHMDVQVIKDATAHVQLVDGHAEIAYTIRVRNNGPNQAHNVVLTDAAPSGVTFVAVTLQPAVGNCTVSAGLLNCTLGTLGYGVERVIGISARVTQAGTVLNCAVAMGDGKDTNGGNNRACASTLVTAPVTPPAPTPKPKPTKPKPKPKPVTNVCRVLKVTPGMVKVNGRKHVVVAKVTKSKTPVRGVKVRFTGVGVNRVVETNKQGVARVGVTPSKSGIMIVRITNVKACNSARIGVVGVFEPPVTG
jgi:uncharacterized repeat protein (TIGR01451 family)